MIKKEIKINLLNLKEKIEYNYFFYRDIFYKALILNLLSNGLINKNLYNNIAIEDSHYNDYLLSLLNSNLSFRDIIQTLDNEKIIGTYIDISIYLDEFINKVHDSNYINIYSLTIEDNGYIVITNKKVKIKR